jgi:5'-methylthioadenosine phosphorylase
MVEEVPVETPFGAPSAPVLTGTLGSLRLAFLARHGRGHTLNPSEVPYRANIWALKALGVTHLLSISAVGSLREELPPRSAAVPDQIIDRTVTRRRTFFEGGVVAHVSMADPFCPALRQAVLDAARPHSTLVHNGGTYLAIEGPQFSTRAESNLYRQWGADIIGMTAMPEARLAREAGICYATLAMVTDYDVWHETEEDVSVEVVQRVLRDNVAFGQEVITGLARHGLPDRACDCAHALDNAVITDPAMISDEQRQRLALLLPALSHITES